NRGQITQPEDEAHFSVNELGSKATDPAVVVLPGQRGNLTVQFKPDIPSVIDQGEKNIPAAKVLPRKVIDQLTLKYDGGKSTIQIQLIARVKPELKLIHPTEPQQPALVILRRSGNSFLIEFSIYDSDLNDIDHAEVAFFDAAHKPVPIKAGDEIIDLKPIIQR